MRILHLLDHSAPLHSGYVFRTLAILRAQRALGWDTVQLTSPKQGGTGTDSEHAEEFEFFRTPHRAGWTDRMPGYWAFDQMRSTRTRLAELVERFRPDLIHAHSPVLNALPALRVGRALRLPVVYEMRASWEDAAVDHGTTAEGSLRYRLSRRLETWALRRVDAVTTICEGLRGDILARGVPADDVTLVPNAVDIERFPLIVERDASLADTLGLDGAEVVGFCGSFYAYEGLDLLLRALPAILAKRPTVKLLLVGGGPAEPALRELASSVGVGSRVVFTGRVPNARVHAYYGLCDLLAFPRHSIRLTELVTPLKPLEAMAQGRPVVASDVGGHRELIEHGETGLLFRAGDADALADAVVRGLSDDALRARLVGQGRRFVERERTWPAVVQRYAGVYERVLRDAARAH